MKRLLSLIIVLCAIFSSIFITNNNTKALDSTEPVEHQGVVSLEGKKIMVVGNSMVYYGNCVIYGNRGQSDEGYLYQLIKQNGENATVIDHTYAGKKLDYIFDNYISKLTEEERDVDYLVLSEGNQDNYNLLSTVERYKNFFPEDVEIRFLRQPMMFEEGTQFYKPWLIEGVETLRQAGYKVVDWGKLVYDIYSGKQEVPGATMEFKRTSFMKENLGFQNQEGTVHGSGKEGDRNHENLLSGYVTAQMLYTSLTNRSAYLTDYRFCYDTSIHEYFNIDNFAKIHYTDPANPTNFNEIFRSPQDMLGLQQLMDERLALDGFHPLTVQPELKATCISSGLTLGSYCKICEKTVEEQKFIPVNAAGGHTLVTKKGEAASCTKGGMSASVYCTDCGHIIMHEAPINATGHKSKTIILKRATTSSNGEYRKVCLYCDSILEEGSIRKVSTVSLSTTDYTYDSLQKTPKVTVLNSGGKSLIEGTDYTLTYPKESIKIGDYKVKVTLKGKYKGSKELTYKIRAKGVNNFKAKAKSTTITLNWEAEPNATHYRIYRYNSKTKTYIKVADTKNTTYMLKKLSRGTKFKFRIRPVTRISGTNYYSHNYKYVTCITTPSTAKISKLTSTKRRVATITFNSVTNAEGYEVIYSTSKSFTNAKTKTVTKKGTTKLTVKKLSSNKKYYFKVRAFRTLSNNKVYGKYSSGKSVIVR